MIHVLNPPSIYPVPVMPEATAKAIWDMKELMDQRLLPLFLTQSVELFRDHFYCITRLDAKRQLPYSREPVYPSKSSTCL